MWSWCAWTYRWLNWDKIFLQTFFHDCWYWKCWVYIKIFHLLFNALNDCEQQCNNISLQCSKLELDSKCSYDSCLIPSLHNHAPHLLHLHPWSTQLATHFWFELFILKLTHCSYPLLIYSLTTNVVHLLNSTLNACFNNHYKITFVGCSSLV